MGRLFFLLALLCPALAFAAAQKPFELRDGDRVVFLGDTLMEREKDFGYIEMMMTLRFPDRNVTFRNLGWSADTPVGISRVSFDWPKGEGEMFRVLMEQVRQVQPTVVVLGYGMASSFDGEAGLEKFKTDYNKLMDAILELNKETRFILLSPIRHEKLPAPLPDPHVSGHNLQLGLYGHAISTIAEKRQCPFIEMEAIGPANHGIHYTDDGIHLNAFGYQSAARVLAEGLGWKRIERIWDYDSLRQAIIAKNQLFFNRWRPENSTYLFLFRKHEQGKNAQDIPKFDPLIQAEEEKIAKLRLEPAKPNGNVFGRLEKPKQSALPDKPATPFKPQAPVHFQLADPNLEVTLWAENPLLAKPIAMNWDARGRLWIASSSVYPQIEPGQAQDDKILILEDTNGDGKADKTIVFADGLLIPTGVEPGDGGCYVGQSTELLHFKDTDGDGIADQKRVVLSGFGTEDTHHILHTLRWGPDGQLYMNQSIYIHSHIETPHGVVRLNSGGTLALRPDTMELGVTMKGLVNGWGHVWDDFGQEFQTDGAGGAPPNGLFWNIPQAMFTTYEGARRTLGSISPGSYPKFCSLELIKSERFPKEWQGNAITCDFRANRVVRFEITEQGAGYTSKQYEFLRTTNITFRPIDVKMGPDGALYIADWSNPIIQHGEVDFRDPRRDRVHGRIWRVAYKNTSNEKKATTADPTNTQLLERLLSPDGFNEKQARRRLIERAQSSSAAREAVISDSKKWNSAKTDDASLGEKKALQHAWMLQALDAVNQVHFASIAELLRAKNPNVRAAATRIVGAWAGNTPGIPSLAKPRRDSDRALELLEQMVQDDHPRVRIEALRALARIPTARSAELALSVLDKGQVEGFLEYALWLTINDLAEPWAAAVESGAWRIEGREKQLQYALKAIEPKLATKLMAKVIGDKPLPRDGSGGLIELIGQAGGPPQLTRLYEQVLNKGFDDKATANALGALAEAAAVRNARPQGDLTRVTTLLESPDDNIRAGAARVAGGWKLKSATPALFKVAGDTKIAGWVRLSAFNGLESIGTPEVVAGLRKLAAGDTDQSGRHWAANALAHSDLKGSLPLILDVLSKHTLDENRLSLWRGILSVKGAAAEVARALTTNQISEPVARAGLRVAREGGRNEPNLVLALNRAGGLSDPSAALTDEEIHAIAYEVTKGDPAVGEKIYRQKQLGCVLCHSIGGAGGKVGPDITSLGASTPVADYIVESVLLPNKKVKEGFNSVQVSTKDGEEISGNLVRETAEELILRDATAREVSIPKRNIASRKMGGSLMPAGLVDFISPQERLHLYAFLKELGKPGPFDATKQNVARVWRLNPKVGTVNADEMLKTDVRANKDWTLLNAMVSGTLPKPDIMEEVQGKNTTVWLASRFQTAKSGATKFKLTGTASPKAWIDGKPVGGDSDLSVDLSAGQHTFFIKVTTDDIAQGIKLESNDVTFLVE